MHPAAQFVISTTTNTDSSYRCSVKYSHEKKLSSYKDDYIPSNYDENRADAIESGGTSAGAGLVPPERQRGSRGEDYRAAIRAVVHPDTLREWHETGLTYQIEPEEQTGIAYIIQTKDSPWRDIAITKMVRAKKEGEEVLIAHQQEKAEDPIHNEVAWEHVVGVRKQSKFEQQYDGVRLKAARKINTSPVYYIPWSKQAAEEILSTHNVRKIPTQFVLDVGYTKFVIHSRDDFLDLSYEELHDKYLKGVEFGPTVARQKLERKAVVERTGDITIAPPPVPSGATEPATYPGISVVNPQQIAQLYFSGEDGKRMADNILAQMPQQKGLEVALLAQQYLQAMREQQVQNQKEQGTTTVDVTLGSRWGNAASTSLFKSEPAKYQEKSSFSKIEHDEAGNPTNRILTNQDGVTQKVPLSKEEAVRIRKEERMMARGLSPAVEAERQGKTIEQILEAEDDEGQPSPLKRKEKDRPKPEDSKQDEPDTGTGENMR